MQKSILAACRVASAIVLVGCGAGARGAVIRSPASTARPQSGFTLITLERKPCFGTCAVYAVSITGEGAVVFDGRQHVDSIRRVASRIDAERVAALVQLFDEAQFFTLDDRYVYGEQNCRIYASDAPTVITSITTGSRVKKVEHDAGCSSVPPRLADLERRIDEIVGTSRWIGHR